MPFERNPVPLYLGSNEHAGLGRLTAHERREMATNQPEQVGIVGNGEIELVMREVELAVWLAFVIHPFTENEMIGTEELLLFIHLLEAFRDVGERNLVVVAVFQILLMFCPMRFARLEEVLHVRFLTFHIFSSPL
jgi:hypothetical protein